MAELFALTKISLRRLLSRARFFVALALSAACVLLCYQKLPSFLARQGMTLQAFEPFIMLFCAHWPQLFLLLSFLLLAGDIPFYHDGMEYVVSRSGRQRWLLAQSCAALVLILIWLAWILVCTLFVFRGLVRLSGDWSTFLKLLARNNLNTAQLVQMGFDFQISPATNMVSAAGPWGMLGLTMLFQLLLFGSIGFWCMALNLWTRRSYGCALTVAFWVFRFALDLQGAELYALTRFSPLSLTDYHTAPLTPARIAYVALFFLLQIVLLGYSSARQIRRADLTKAL